MLTFEYANITHQQLLFDWANDPETRRNSYSTDLIQWENHVRWFNKKLADPTCKIYIFRLDKEFCGMARIEKMGDEIVIGVSVSAEHRGKGLASQIIRQSSEDYTGKMNVKRINAYIKADNPASQKAFEKAGYKELIEMEVQGSVSKKYIYGI